MVFQTKISIHVDLFYTGLLLLGLMLFLVGLRNNIRDRMAIQEDTATKPQMKDEQKQLLFRKKSDLGTSDRLNSSMNEARRSLGIPEIH